MTLFSTIRINAPTKVEMTKEEAQAVIGRGLIVREWGTGYARVAYAETAEAAGKR
jgi:hypothetical protein